MAVGLPAKTTYANGDVFSASDINDTNGTINLVGQTQNFYAGKNKIINGDFGVWQRGTSFTTPATGSYTADRWVVNYNGIGSTRTISRQTFTAGTAPVSGYESSFFYRYAQSVAGTTGTFSNFATRLEDVRLLAGQTATISYWAKADATRAVTANIEQNFGSGGSSPVYTTGTSVNLTTSWVRYTQTFTVPSISGKTIGTSSFLSPYFDLPLNTTFTIDVWGVQLEVGSTATAFQTATGTIQGELAACQRYYWRNTSGKLYGFLAFGGNINATNADCVVNFPITMRTNPTAIEYANLGWYVPGAGTYAVSAVAINGDYQSTYMGRISLTITSGTSTGGIVGYLLANNNTAAYLSFTAEL